MPKFEENTQLVYFDAAGLTRAPQCSSFVRTLSFIIILVYKTTVAALNYFILKPLKISVYSIK